MELSLLIFQDLLSKFLVGAAGYLAIKKRICSAEAGRILAGIGLYFTGPCSLFGAFQAEFSMTFLRRYGIAVVLSAAVILFFMGAALAGKKLFGCSALEQACLIYSNNGTFILSMVSVLLGKEALLYLSAYTAAHCLFFFTHGMMYLGGQKKINWKNLLNPNLLGIYLGFLIFLCRIQIPEVLEKAVNDLGSMHGSLCMLTVGMALAVCDFKKTFGMLRVWMISLARLILLPAAAVVIVFFSGITRQNPDLRMLINVVIIAASGPAANQVLQVALLQEGDGRAEVDVATSVNTVSTCLCIVTIPLVTMLYQVLCG